MEGRGEDRAFPHRHRVAVVGGEHLHPGPLPLDPGRADEDRPQRLVADPIDLEIGLEALQLPAEGVAAGAGVEKAEVVRVADDQAGAGAEDRAPRLVVGAQRRLQTLRFDALDDRRALAARDDQAVESFEILGNAYLRRLGAQLAQDAGVRIEVALDR
jgi:hypothetical protein